MCLLRLFVRPVVSLSPVIVLALLAGSSQAAETPAPDNSVVKIYASVRYPDLYKPWTKKAATDLTGTGVVIEGKRILTTADNVLYASQIQIQGQSGDRISATIEVAAPGVNLAVLKLEDQKFFDSHPPLQLALALPETKAPVIVYGFAESGSTSLTSAKGSVARIDFAPYSAAMSGLRIQLDGTIPQPSGGGPAFAGEKMIGIAYSRAGLENAGAIIPSDEIQLFLQDIADGHYDGKPAMWDDVQSLENPTLRAFLKLDKTVQGVVVRKPLNSDAAYPLKEWDVITKLGDTPVDDQGTIKLGPNLRVRFQYLVQKVVKDGKLPLTIVRQGKEQQISLPVSNERPLVLPELDGSYPSYFIYGPLVFSTATAQYLSGITRDRNGLGAMTIMAALGSPLVERIGDKPAFPGERLVIVAAPLFPHKLSAGYSNPASLVVKSVNGVRIKNLPHLVEVLRDSKDEFLAFEFDTRLGETPVFPRAEMAKVTDDILIGNEIRSQGSPDTLAIWNAKK